jgi:aminoglycoside phosphotransferase (APT) family kinase protein
MAADKVAVPEEFAHALRELGLAGAWRLEGTPLTGGVSSDIWRIDTERGPVCAKRALPKLRVAADWQAPIERNAYEARWMRIANQAFPGCTPQVLGQHPQLGVLVMSFLPPSEYRVWKQALREGHVDLAVARAVGTVLARIHGFSAARPELAEQFATDAIFFDIRLEPYLVATARHHPDLAPMLERLLEATRSHTLALVHGDVSPKNILIGPHGPVLLDAECAWWGDPAFDIAFCLNHLLLKCLWNAAASNAFLTAFETLSETYLQAVNWEPRHELEHRAAALLPGLFLARVDGKSPVEYVTDETQRDRVRRVAGALLRKPAETLRSVCAAWREEISR